MRTLSIASFCALALLFQSDRLSAQERQQVVITSGGPVGEGIQIGGPGRQFKTGTGRIRGRVVSAETGAPVRRAQVRISGPDVMSKTALTDSQGRYDFRDLPASRFTLTAMKSGYVQVEYGQTRPFESGKSIELTEAQAMDKADIAMPRGSVIAGRVLDEFGEPVTDAVVTAMRSRWSNGRRRLQAAGRTATTNDLGQFRLFGLPPGDYYVSATLRGTEAMMMEVEAAMMSASGGGPTPSASSPSSGYAPTYFPGTTSGTDAQKITVAAGQEANGIDFPLLAVKLAKITGTVVGSDGKPMSGAMISAVPRSSDASSGMMMIGGSTRTDKNGNFAVSNVAPGDYTLQARALQMIMNSGEGDTMMFTARIGGGGDSEFGSVPLAVNGDDVTSVIIMTSKGASATGHVTFEGGAQPSNLSALRVIASSIDMDGPSMGGGASSSVKPDGSFELKGMAGARLIRASGLNGWTLKSVSLNGRDVTDTGVEFRGTEAATGLDVVLTSKLTEVSGTVAGTDGDTVKDYTIVIFAEDPQRWTVPATRYVTGSRPDQQGRFQVKNLPAGSYYAVAVDYIPQGEWGDPELLDRLKDKAKRFTLGEGETKTLDLKLSQ